MGNLHHHALNPGRQLHWYLIERVLGQGGFGITYLAQDQNLRTNVAIKEFFPSALTVRSDSGGRVSPANDTLAPEYQKGLERFVAEAQTLARFDHPNIVRVLSVFEADGTAYMVMRYEAGESLDQRLAGRKTLAEAELRRLLPPLLDGLEKVHAAGFLHRDIKPANIFLRTDASPVLLDFGAARQALGEVSRSMTTIVSPGYAPIEQYYSDAKEQGPWTDIYAFGATLYRATVGIAPPPAVDRSQALLKGVKDILVPAAEAAAGHYAPELLAAIDAALAFREADRPQSIAAWRCLFGCGQTRSPDEAVTIARPESPPPAVAGTPTAASRSDSEPSSRPMIAVLPFVNLSNDPEQEFFADGITDDIITGLSLWRYFPVIARNTMFTYKGKAIDIKQVGQDLGARYVVEGSVRKSGNRVRVTTRLIDARENTQVWGDRFEGALDDVFALQDEITERLASAIFPEIRHLEEQRALQKRPADLGSWELVQRGIAHHGRIVREENARAHEFFAQARQRDPTNAAAYNWDAAALIMDIIMGWADDPRAALMEADRLMRQAIEIDPQDTLSLACYSACLVFQRQWEAGLQEARRAVKLNPNNAIAQHCLALALIYGAMDDDNIREGIKGLKTAMKLSPRDYYLPYFLQMEATGCYLLGDYHSTLAASRKALLFNANYYRAFIIQTCALAQLGEREAASQALEKVRQYYPKLSRTFLEASFTFSIRRIWKKFWMACARPAGKTERSAELEPISKCCQNMKTVRAEPSTSLYGVYGSFLRS